MRPLPLLGGTSRRGPLSTAASSKPRLWTVKDRRPNRPREAKTKRLEYLAQRKAAFDAEEEKAEAVGLGWNIRSAL